MRSFAGAAEVTLAIYIKKAVQHAALRESWRICTFGKVALCKFNGHLIGDNCCWGCDSVSKRHTRVNWAHCVA